VAPNKCQSRLRANPVSRAAHLRRTRTNNDWQIVSSKNLTDRFSFSTYFYVVGIPLSRRGFTERIARDQEPLFTERAVIESEKLMG